MKNIKRYTTAGFLGLLIAFFGCQDYPRGELIYANQCASCHMDDGTGLGVMIPSLQYSEVLQDDLQNLVCLIRNGVEVSAADSSLLLIAMPPFDDLTETDLSNLINYMNTAWDNDFPKTSPFEVREALSDCQ